ncbi:MAG: putative nuclease of the RNAse H fold, HicB family [Verrucomicrobia bacterium]|jgi:predicted RNase H-like HicB family nuclease|nr:MAG: putative nuclease of the RNAse H fold, HicB family [Verrucomicrobiota bacterium]
MISYTARYKFLDGGVVHAEVVDFPGVVSCADSLDAARRMVQSALVDLAELALESGEALPLPGRNQSDLDGDLDEPVHLLLTATRKVVEVPESSAA